MSFTDIDKFKLLSAVGDPAVRDKLVLEIESATPGQIALANTKIIVGNSSGVGAAVTMSGDATLANTGAITVGANKITASKLQVDTLQYAQVTVPTASVLTLKDTPYQLVAAPGTGLVVIPVALYATLTFNSAAYATDAAGFSVRYTNGSGASTAMTITQAFAQSSASAIFHINAGTTAITPVANAKLVLYADNANPTTGDSDLKIQIYYRIVSNPAF
jgi:hypothetical protein